MEGKKDWRRHGTESERKRADSSQSNGFLNLGNFGERKQDSNDEQPRGHFALEDVTNDSLSFPKMWFLTPSKPLDIQSDLAQSLWNKTVKAVACKDHDQISSTENVPWKRTSFRVYGRGLPVSRHLSGVTQWSFNEICGANLGPADYITLASAFHTFILVDVPVLTLLQKNEARRFITLLDALYEARCKLLIRASAGPDDIFFPETKQPSGVQGLDTAQGGDSVYPETFSEIYQDQTSPFRPNISSYASSASPPSYDSSPLPESAFKAQLGIQSTRSILADEDSDFGPTYGAGRSSLNGGSRYRGASDGTPGAGNEIGHNRSLDFGRTGVFTGEDERFAYKRATSRLWKCVAQSGGQEMKKAGGDLSSWPIGHGKEGPSKMLLSFRSPRQQLKNRSCFTTDLCKNQTISLIYSDTTRVHSEQARIHRLK